MMISASSNVPNSDLIAVVAGQFDALQTQVRSLQQDKAQLLQQLDWYKRQLFGAKSEKRTPIDTEQGALFVAPAPPDAPAPSIDVPAHKRVKQRTGDEVNDTGLRFGADVPVREIKLSCPELDGADADQYEVIGYKTSCA